MIQRKWSPVSVCVTVIIGLSFIFTGCAKQPAQTLGVDKAPATEQETIAQKQSAAEKEVKLTRSAGGKGSLPVSYVVKEGDSLWWIAKYKDIYNDPYLWPVLYDANKNVIKDPNKINPGMKLQIPRAGYKPADIQNARKTAGACKPYNPPARAVPPAD
jgi:LysM repeat protein